MPWPWRRSISACAAVASSIKVVSLLGREEFGFAGHGQADYPYFGRRAPAPPKAGRFPELWWRTGVNWGQNGHWRSTLPSCSFRRAETANFLTPASVLSNSWLPKVKVSKQTVFMSSASALPSVEGIIEITGAGIAAVDFNHMGGLFFHGFDGSVTPGKNRPAPP